MEFFNLPSDKEMRIGSILDGFQKGEESVKEGDLHFHPQKGVMQVHKNMYSPTGYSVHYVKHDQHLIGVREKTPSHKKIPVGAASDNMHPKEISSYEKLSPEKAHKLINSPANKKYIKQAVDQWHKEDKGARRQNREIHQMRKQSGAYQGMSKKEVKDSRSEGGGIKKGNSDYKVYHNSYTSAVNEARDYAKKRGFKHNDDEVFQKVTTGPGRPKEGKTHSFSLDLSHEKTGKPYYKAHHIQIHGMGDKYELNQYIH